MPPQASDDLDALLDGMSPIGTSAYDPAQGRWYSDPTQKEQPSVFISRIHRKKEEPKDEFDDLLGDLKLSPNSSPTAKPIGNPVRHRTNHPAGLKLVPLTLFFASLDGGHREGELWFRSTAAYELSVMRFQGPFAEPP